MTDTQERAVVRGKAAKDTDGIIREVRIKPDIHYPEWEKLMKELGWTIVPVEIRELEPDQIEEGR